MKYLVTIPLRKSTLIYVARKGCAYIEVLNGQEVELTQDEMIIATQGADGAVTFAPVFAPVKLVKGDKP